MSLLPPIRHPGPVAAERCATALAEVVPLTFRIRAGDSVEQGIARGLADAGCDAAWIELHQVRLDPFGFVIPAGSPGPEHAAWYSETFRPAGGVRVQRAGAIVGRREGAVFVHCHGLWQGDSGPLRMGHMLPDQCVAADDLTVSGVGLRGGGFESLHDAETHFTLFRAAPRHEVERGADTALLATLRPNQDVSNAIATLCDEMQTGAASIFGIGSLNGALFASGGAMHSYASELLVRTGRYDPDANRRARHPVSLDVAVVDMDGVIHEGVLRPGENPVCVTFELVVVPDAARSSVDGRWAFDGHSSTSVDRVHS